AAAALQPHYQLRGGDPPPAAAVELRQALFGGAHDGRDALAETAFVLQTDHVAFAQNRERAGDMAVEQARRLQLLAPQADHERLPGQVGMERDVMQGAYGNRGARRIDG